MNSMQNKENKLMGTNLTAVNLDREITTIYYKHKINAEEVITESEIKAAWEKQLNPADYEKVTVVTSPRKQLTAEIFGNEDFVVTQKDVDEASRIFEIVKQLLVRPSVIKIKTPFQKEKAAAQAKIQNVKAGTNKSITLDEAKAELLAVYAKHGETYVPREKKVADTSASDETNALKITK